ncbi:MAG: hypothetical protein PHU80_09940, partial [Kiritimatiellae bacterium]|nr:hypothetical protein [Kiritimatiellia bacterium]
MSKVAKRCVCVILIATACGVNAATRTWQTSNGGIWTEGGNWSDNTPPVAGDTADLSAATGVIDIATDVAVGEIIYNPAFSGETNVLTILSASSAPNSHKIAISDITLGMFQVAEGAELRVDADLTPAVDVLKDGRGSLVIKRNLAPTAAVQVFVEQGALVNEGSIQHPMWRMFVGTRDSDDGPAAGYVMRDGSSHVG